MTVGELKKYFFNIQIMMSVYLMTMQMNMVINNYPLEDGENFIYLVVNEEITAV